MISALVLVDFENEWIDENSEYYVGDIKEVMEKVNKLIDYCREKGYKIIFVRHVEKEGPEFKESKGAKLMSCLHREDDDTVITKHKISPFYQTELDDELQGINALVVCGILTNLCVRSLVQDAYDRDFAVKVIKDCCVALSEEVHEFTLKDLKETRPEVEFVTLKGFSQL